MILAGVGIATLTGENGILTQAGQAKEQTEKAAIEEKIKLENMALKNGYTKGYGGVCSLGSLKEGCGKIIINGGTIVAENSGNTAEIGGKCSEVKITGGTIKVTSTNSVGISCAEGGNIFVRGKNIILRNMRGILNIIYSDR